MKKTLCLLAALLLLLVSGTATGGEVILLPEEVITNPWYQNRNAKVKIGNPTPLRGCFFTTMWGGTTSDLDVQEMLHAYSPILWDGELGRFRFDHSVVQDAVVMDDENGDRVFLLVLDDDLFWSDGTPITARDYAFSFLLQMDPSVAETGGKPLDCSWIAGSDEYLGGQKQTLSGLRLIADDMLQITMKAESLPYFYDLYRLNIFPYPASEIAPGVQVRDDGEGAYLTRPLTAQILQEYVLDGKIGYLRHPRVVSGPYVLASFDGTTASLAINPHYKGNEEGMIPRIGTIEYTAADNADMIEKLADGSFDLLNKVTMADSIQRGIDLLKSDEESYAMDNDIRAGLTMLWFSETSMKVQDPAVRKAVAYCFDRDAFVNRYTGSFGIRVDGFYGLGQWMYQTAAGLSEAPVMLPENATKQEREAYETALNEWNSFTLDNLTLYEKNTEEAVRLLEGAGWNLNEKGDPFDSTKDRYRYKKTDDGLTELSLILEIPESKETRIAIETCLTSHLREAGIALRVKTTNMEAIQEAYAGRAETEADLLYLGENFSIAFDPDLLMPHTQGTELAGAKEELYSLALDMVRTEPGDLTGFERKWIRLQERITERLPLLPVYSNVYFDFFTRALHNYSISNVLNCGKAIVSAYISDVEELDETEKQRMEEKVAKAETFMKKRDIHALLH